MAENRKALKAYAYIVENLERYALATPGGSI